MENLQKVHKITGFLLSKGEDEISRAFHETHEVLREKLGLPPDIKLSGLTLQHDQHFTPQEVCQKMCTSTDSEGRTTIFCCKPNIL